jgi:hypothetical protein
MNLQKIWRELFPDQPWPGNTVALVQALVEEVQTLRLLTDTIVTTAVEDQMKRRDLDQIQRAHDLVGQYCVEMNDAASFEHVSALCWVLHHDHNTAFAQILEAVEADITRRGLRVMRLSEVHDPGREQ